MNLNITQIIPATGWAAYTEREVHPLVAWGFLEKGMPSGGVDLIGLCLDAAGKDVIPAKSIEGFRKYGLLK